MPHPCCATVLRRRKASTAIDSRPSLRVSVFPSRTAAALPTPSGPKGSSGNRRCRTPGRLGKIFGAAHALPAALLLKILLHNHPTALLLTQASPARPMQRPAPLRARVLILPCFGLRRAVVNHHIHLINAAHFVQMRTHGLFRQVGIALFEGFEHTNVSAV